MLCNEQRTGTKKKTHVKKKTLNPVFNESFVFDLPQHLEGTGEGGEGGGANCIKNISFEFQLLDWDRVTKNEVRNRRELRIQIGGGKGTLTYQFQLGYILPRPHDFLSLLWKLEGGGYGIRVY